MKQVDIDRMKEIEAKATPGPWGFKEYFDHFKPCSGWEHRGTAGSFRGKEEDAEFIAAARTFVPQAIAEIERLTNVAFELCQTLVDALEWFEYDGTPETLPEIDALVIRFAPPNPKRGDRKKIDCCYGADLEIGDRWAYPPLPSNGGTRPITGKGL